MLNLLPLLACPVGMGLMMWMMRSKKADPVPAAPVVAETTAPSVELLREERRRLDAAIEGLETADRPASRP